MKPEYRRILILAQVPDWSLDYPSVFHIFIEFLDFLRLVVQLRLIYLFQFHLFSFIFCAPKALP